MEGPDNHLHMLHEANFACIACGRTLAELRAEGVPPYAMAMLVMDEGMLGIMEEANNFGG